MIETLIRNSITKGIVALAAFNRKRLPKESTPHPFLSGIHEPMSKELTLTDLTVTGAIPKQLNGRYLRIGPNPITVDPLGYHWFSGDGMVHGVRLEYGRALWYRNRWIRSSAVAAALKEPLAPGPRHGSLDTVNTNVLGIGNRTWAMVEAGSFPVEISDTLEQQAYNDFDGSLAGSFTAHPHLDPITGEHHAICYEATKASEIRHVVISPQGRVVREQPIVVKHGPSVHDCAITSRFVVILDLPVTFSMMSLIRGHRFPYRWNDKHQARVGLLPRAGKDEDIIWCNIDPSYVFHVANAYDTADGGVIIDVCAYGSMFADSLKGPDAASRGLERWTIDPVARSVAIRTIDASPQEFPRIDERRFGQPYRYAYVLALPEREDPKFVGATALYRHDLQTGIRQTHDFGPNRHPGEFVVVPDASNSAEGQGWLMGLVVDMATQTTDLVILDVAKFESAPVASVRIPHRVPPGFHGNWVADFA